MKLLRDLRKITKFLILLELSTKHTARLSTLANKLDMSVQGVYEYVKLMMSEDLIHMDKDKGEYRATKKGIQLLHETFTKFQQFVNTVEKELSIINTCVAIARTKIRENDKVGLFMEKGILVAYKNRKSSSYGIATTNAKIGDEIVLKDLEGIVTLKSGILYVYKVLSPVDTGKPCEKLKINNNIRYDLVAVHGIEAMSTSEKSNLKADIKFASIDACIEACQKGLNVLFLVSSPDFNDIIARIEEKNGIEYKIIG